MTTTPADELRAAASQLRQARFPAAMTATASTAALIRARLPLAELLETAADYVADDSPTHPTHLVRALAVARTINAT